MLHWRFLQIYLSFYILEPARFIAWDFLRPFTDPQVLLARSCVRLAFICVHIFVHIVGCFFLAHAGRPQAHMQVVIGDLHLGVGLAAENDAVDHAIELRFIKCVGDGGRLFLLPVRPMGAEALLCEHDPGL